MTTHRTDYRKSGIVYNHHGEIDVERSSLRAVIWAEGGNLGPSKPVEPPVIESTKPTECPYCGSTDIRPDDHEMDPGWRCHPKGHVVFEDDE